jgi:hypothetical protein
MGSPSLNVAILAFNFVIKGPSNLKNFSFFPHPPACKNKMVVLLEVLQILTRLFTRLGAY